MAEEQLKLFALGNALQERFDRAFFRSVPPCPGIYLMFDRADRLIYVGKAKNLRQRVGSYRYAPGRCSRKTARLVACVAKICWQVCDSEQAALLEENRLLREVRPRFNRMNTWPRASRFVRLDVRGATVKLSLTAEPDGECYGAFKGASQSNFIALLRLLWTLKASYALLPRPLLLEDGRAHYEFDLESAAHWIEPLRDLLLGGDDGLLKKFLAAAAYEGNRFHAAFRESDLLAVEHFFHIGPQRNRILREQFGAGDLILQDQLDDLLVRHRHVAPVNAPTTSRP